MSKCSAAAEAPGASPSKRPHIEPVESPYTPDDGSRTPSLSSAESPVTTATTPRAKFPSDLKTLACTWPGCPKTFNRPARLRDHLNSHTNSRPFKCPYDDCDKDYIEDKHLKQHVKAVHTRDRRYVCQRDGCGKTFVTGTRLKRHQAVHDGADRFRCPDCGQSFRKRETLHKHVRKDHLGVPAHECPEPGCGAAFDSKPALKRHHDKEHGDVRYWCDECGVQMANNGSERRVGFTTEPLLQGHLKQEHQDCLFCDYKSPSRWELERHVEMRHSGKTVDDRKVHACPHSGCAKSFTKKSNLNIHIRTAHEGFRFVCGDVALSGPDFEAWSCGDGCGDRFSTKARLEDHVRFIHLGHERPRLSKPERPEPDVVDEISGMADQAKHTIPCPHCDRTFVRYHDLDVHLSKGHDDASSDPASLLAHEVAPEPPAFAHDYAQSAWPEDMAHEDIFAAEMEYGPPRDDWPEDEANMLLLMHDPPAELDPSIDPALAA